MGFEKIRKFDFLHSTFPHQSAYRASHYIWDLVCVYMWLSYCSVCPILLAQVEIWPDGHGSRVAIVKHPNLNRQKSWQLMCTLPSLLISDFQVAKNMMNNTKLYFSGDNSLVGGLLSSIYDSQLTGGGGRWKSVNQSAESPCTTDNVVYRVTNPICSESGGVTCRITSGWKSPCPIITRPIDAYTVANVTDS